MEPNREMQIKNPTAIGLGVMYAVDVCLSEKSARMIISNGISLATIQSHPDGSMLADMISGKSNPIRQKIEELRSALLDPEKSDSVQGLETIVVQDLIPAEFLNRIGSLLSSRKLSTDFSTLTLQELNRLLGPKISKQDIYDQFTSLIN